MPYQRIINEIVKLKHNEKHKRHCGQLEETPIWRNCYVFVRHPHRLFKRRILFVQKNSKLASIPPL